MLILINLFINLKLINIFQYLKNKIFILIVKYFLF